MEAIAVAGIAALASIFGSYFANRKSSALLEYRMVELERTVKDLKDDRTEIQGLKTHIEVLEERIKVANNRIKDLENGSHSKTV